MINSNDQIWKSKFGDDSIEFWEEKSPKDPTFWKKAKFLNGETEVDIEFKTKVWHILDTLIEKND
jgi:hypothetical protein